VECKGRGKLLDLRNTLNVLCLYEAVPVILVC